jgi:Protein of unknown function (DUF3012)
MNRILKAAIILMFISALTACAPEVGSDAWCEDMAEKSKGDWTTNEAKEFAKSCIFKEYDDN